MLVIKLIFAQSYKALFYTQLCNTGVGTVLTTFILCQLNFCEAPLIGPKEWNRKAGRVGMLLFTICLLFLSASPEQLFFIPATALGSSVQFFLSIPPNQPHHSLSILASVPQSTFSTKPSGYASSFCSLRSMGGSCFL